MLEINYKFVPEFESEEARIKSDIRSYAGKLLEILQMCVAIVYLDEDNKPVVMASNSRLTDALDFSLTEY